MNNNLNVLGLPLSSCCFSPLTGFTRHGFCELDHRDLGRHTVCVQITSEFLDISLKLGNDLISHSPNRPILTEGDFWCICVKKWIRVIDTGYQAKIKIEACHSSVLEYISLDELKKYAL